LLKEIVPSRVACAEAFGDARDAVLFPAEEAVVAGAVPMRRREFATARFCARRALAELGVAPAPLLPGPRGAPSWPAGVVGSITHCAGYRASAVASRARMVTVGIDAEPDAPLPPGVLDVVASAEERAWVRTLSRTDPRVCWDRLLFSVKESVFKAWYPLARSWLGFEQAHVTVDPARNRFAARLLVPGPRLDGRELAGFAGRWVVRNGLVLTAVTLAAPPPAHVPRQREWARA
jgi:4'-phosphopantetheinyl transferase EntD